MAFDREKTLHVAQKYIEKRKYDRAIGEYQKVVQHDPNDARTLLRIGDLQSRLGSYAEAIASYDRVARFYAGRGFSLKAIAVFKQIGEMLERHAPHLTDQYSHVPPKLAQIYAELGLVNDALATYEGAVRRLQSAGRERDVVDIFRKMVALDASNPLPYLRLAEALCRLGRLDEAIEHFWSAAQLLTQAQRAEDALKVIERILHFRQDVRVCRVAAELYLARGTREAGLLALSRLQACFDADPKDLETLILLARAFEILGQSSKSIEVYKEMVRIATDAGEEELRRRYLSHLLRVAPNDAQVLLFAQAPTSPAPERVPSSVPESGPESLQLDDIEFLDDDALDDAEELATAVTSGLSERAHAKRPEAPARQPASNLEESPAALLEQALLDAEAFRGLGLYDKALDVLQSRLRRGPDCAALRCAFGQVLCDSGQEASAIRHLVRGAELHVEEGSTPVAVAALQHVLSLDPAHAGAQELLSQLEAPVELKSSAVLHQTGEHEAFELRARVVPSEPPGTAGRAPLPSYSLEYDELEYDDAQPLDSEIPEPIESTDLDAVTEIPPAKSLRGGAPPPSSAQAEAPLPQFTLEELNVSPSPPSVGVPSTPAASVRGGQMMESVAPVSAPVASAVAISAPPPSRGVLPAPAPEEVLPGSPPPSRNASGSEAPSLFPETESVARRESIRAALDEVEFFSSRGLYQDAAMILKDRLEQYPGERGLTEALISLQDRLSSDSLAPGRISVGPATLVQSDPTPQTIENTAVVGTRFTTDGSSGGGAVLDVEDDMDLVASLEQPAGVEIDVDEVFAKFKQGVKAQISDSDSATHYDLGVAYKEMGLLSDAAHEFELASRDPKLECNSLAMMGMMYRGSGDLNLAAEAYVRGLNAGQKTVSQEVSLYYELGCIYQDKQDPEEAVYYFQRITRRVPNYRDVAVRLAEVEAALPPSSPPPAGG